MPLVRHAIPLFLTEEDLGYLDFVAQGLSKKRNTEVSRSEAVSFIILRHKIKVMKRTAERRHDERVRAIARN